ncbi:hypothetical protein [Amycolatopsis jejuensis]|uniref:hypothetical protein n=1 Tax=Amycolatopsis jejuensis TaxID=330084 RepID=UPI0005264C3D|nr:hypothetical protein [Amycolatopsis jejuensis]
MEPVGAVSPVPVVSEVDTLDVLLVGCPPVELLPDGFDEGGVSELDVLVGEVGVVDVGSVLVGGVVE